MPAMTFQDAVNFLYHRTNYEVNRAPLASVTEADLDRFWRFLKRLGNPEKEYPCIVVAGSNGKGSTCAFLAGMLQEAGFRTGLSTSPHLVTPRERIRLNGLPVSEDRFAGNCERLKTAVEAFPEAAGLTTFDLLTALALLVFKESQIQVAILEVGLGGRLDSNNAVEPFCSVISAISSEHTEILGNTLEKIAWEKAGIMRRGVPVIIGPQVPEAGETLRRLASERKAPLSAVSQEDIVPLGVKQQTSGQWKQTFRFRKRDFQAGMAGAHQAENGALAIRAAEVLSQNGIKIPKEAIEKGLCATAFPGRFQCLGRGENLEYLPRLGMILDGAHNAAGIIALRKTLSACYGRDLPIGFLVSVSSDKPLESMIATLAAPIDSLIIVKGTSPRSLSLAEACRRLQHFGRPFTAAESFRHGTKHLGSLKPAPALWCVTGSLFFMGDVLKEIGWLPDSPLLFNTEKYHTEAQRP